MVKYLNCSIKYNYIGKFNTYLIVLRKQKTNQDIICTLEIIKSMKINVY